MTTPSGNWCDRVLVVTVDGPEGHVCTTLENPFLDVGSFESPEIVLPGGHVRPWSLHLRASDAGVFCVSLAPSGEDGVAVRGWLDPARSLTLGPYRITARLLDIAHTLEQSLRDLEARQSAAPPYYTATGAGEGVQIGGCPVSGRRAVAERHPSGVVQFAGPSAPSSHAVSAGESASGSTLREQLLDAALASWREEDGEDDSPNRSGQLVVKEPGRESDRRQLEPRPDEYEGRGPGWAEQGRVAVSRLSERAASLERLRAELARRASALRQGMAELEARREQLRREKASWERERQQWEARVAAVRDGPHEPPTRNVQAGQTPEADCGEASFDGWTRPVTKFPLEEPDAGPPDAVAEQFREEDAALEGLAWLARTKTRWGRIKDALARLLDRGDD